jgi:hypothetical protein
MEFDVIDDITGTQTIATGTGIRELAVYVSAMVADGGVNVRVSRKFAFHPAKYYGPSYTGMRLLALEK